MNIKQIEKKIEKAESRLTELKYSSFRKDKQGKIIMLSKYERDRHDEDIINARNELFDSYHKQQILGGNKINFTKLASLLGKDRKTVRKYFNARIQKKEIIHGNKNKRSNNSVNDWIREKYIHEIDKLVSETSVFLSKDKNKPKKVLLVLTQVCDEVDKLFKPRDRVNISTIRKWLRDDGEMIFKYSTKARKSNLASRKRILKQIETNNELLRTNKLKHAIESKEITNHYSITPEKEIEDDKKYRPDAGLIIQWDGSYDDGYNGKKFLRVQAVDSRGFSYGISYAKHETNKGYIEVLAKTLKHTYPRIILADRRRGIDPSQLGALVAAICINLGITIIASSDSNNKPVIEKINGLMHSHTSIYFYKNNIKTLKGAKDVEDDINKKYNEFYNYHPVKNAELVSDKIIEFIKSDIAVEVTDNPQFIRFKKGAYQLVEDSKIINHDIGVPIVIGKINGIIKALWNKKLYNTVKLHDAELKTSYLARSIMKDKLRNNGIVVMNTESFDYLTKDFTKNIDNYGKE